MFTVAALQEMWANAWPVISLLLACSVFSFAIIFERWVTLGHWGFDREALMTDLRRPLAERKREQAMALCLALKRPIGKILSVLIDPPAVYRSGGREALSRLSDRLVRGENSKMLRYITFLGTIGSV